MYSVTGAFNTACAAPGREITSKIKFNGTNELPGSEVQEISVTEQFGSSDGVTIGASFSSQCKVVIYKESAGALSGGNFIPYVGVSVDGTVKYVPKGKFYISSDSMEKTGKLWLTITGYDRMAGLTADYVPTITFPATPAQVLADVCKQANVTPPAVTMPSIQIAAPYTGTLREQLGWLAGLVGCNAKFDATGNLVFCWYADNGLTLGWDVQYMDGLEITSDGAFTINSLLSGTESNPISVGSGTGITSTNPYMTAEVAESIFAKISGKQFTPCKVKWRGNPAVESGDSVSVTGLDGKSLTVYVMEQRLTVKGGMSADTTCYGTGSDDYAVGSPTEQKFKRMYDDVLKSFQDATEKIIGAKGGYFEITYNEDGYPSGWQLRDTPQVEDNTKMWIMSIGGLGFSQDGGKTISNVALTMDGEINGAALALGSVQQDAVSGLSQKFTALDGQMESKISKEEAANEFATHQQITDLQQNVNSIILSALENYVKTGDFGSYKEEVSTRLSILTDQLGIDITKITERIDNVDGDLQSKYSEITKAFRFTSDGLLIGETGNEIVLRLDNDVLQFVRNNTPELQITAEGVEADRVKISILIIGNVIHQADDDGDEIVY